MSREAKVTPRFFKKSANKLPPQEILPPAEMVPSITEESSVNLSVEVASSPADHINAPENITGSIVTRPQNIFEVKLLAERLGKVVEDAYLGHHEAVANLAVLIVKVHTDHCIAPITKRKVITEYKYTEQLTQALIDFTPRRKGYNPLLPLVRFLLENVTAKDKQSEWTRNNKYANAVFYALHKEEAWGAEQFGYELKENGGLTKWAREGVKLRQGKPPVSPIKPIKKYLDSLPACETLSLSESNNIGDGFPYKLLLVRQAASASLDLVHILPDDEKLLIKLVNKFLKPGKGKWLNA